jgi:hypothetical protein
VITLVAVAVLVPVYAWCQVKSPALGLALYCRVYLGGMLVLIVGLPLGRSIECAASPAFVSQSQVPVQSYVIILILPLIESLRPAVASVQLSLLRPAVTIAPCVVC